MNPTGHVRAAVVPLANHDDGPLWLFQQQPQVHCRGQAGRFFTGADGKQGERFRRAVLAINPACLLGGFPSEAMACGRMFFPWVGTGARAG
jgi:hypothetical protein